jgi:nitroreductase
MELLQAIKERRTIRKFKPDPISKELLEELIKNAMWAPSAMNTQPWKFYVFTGASRQGLISIAEGCIDQLDSRMEKLFNEKMRNMVRGYFHDFGGAPAIVVLVSHLPSEAVYQKGSLFSASAAMQNFLLLAHEAGLGTCWMTGPLWVEEDIISYLNCPGWGLVGLTPIGWPEQSPPIPPRKHEVIEWRE